MSKSNSKSETGKFGEDEAALFLVNKGYEILHRNWRCGKDELDIVALHDEILVVVEVKTRTGTAFGMPWESVDDRKQQAIERAALTYLEAFAIDRDLRFDIVSIIVSPDKDVWIDHIENAFVP
ncbi:MAG: hypothetical protein A2W93_15140 [Bacteroidetes bacterium GWF2_43_63]|nr:MAG: hypothetical protein A2W94_04160 [Bacteroidetes bacterium GWE2_42_42]OFY54082.1 MAG: hypothetical protein A2W93_15140 [Bacteroidetes bacterium GWF2_43_63]HBG69724.1 YraN family protein [Bacteroidales bacterium]HCB61100.1 YraN family protein [Bacteroidales bacterium]HCY23400.1 YraN family protein [Bacteroidales bacterium]